MILLFLAIFGFSAFAILAELAPDQEPQTEITGLCPVCGSAAERDWLLCLHCRTPLKFTCRSCGHTVARFHAFRMFCTYCGTRREKEVL